MTNANINIEEATKLQAILDNLPPEAYEPGLPRRSFLGFKDGQPVGAYMVALREAESEAARGVHRTERRCIEFGLALSGLSAAAIGNVMAQAAQSELQ
ncbi:MAG TPA: hypothetical protein VFH39_00005 [Candidatus Saccharimonadales bacterium]|nr:hypothetical protein [Candidatus Saccharimonadales bacterium]